MPDLKFTINKAEPVEFAAAPMLHFNLGITDSGPPQTIQAIVLRCQVWIEPGKRAYDPAEKEKLFELFGETSRWGQTLRSMLWTNASVVVPPWSESTTVDLPVPCTFDFNIAAAKYFFAVEGDEAPVRVMFSGTIFHCDDDQTLRVAQIPWDREATFKMPVRIWKRMMEHYYPNAAWLCLRRDAFDRLYEFKRQNSFSSWEAAIEALLSAAPDAQRVTP